MVFMFLASSISGPGSSVCIANDYGLDGPGIESRWRRHFPPVQTDPGTHPASCTMGTGSFPGVKCGRGVTLTPHPLLIPLDHNWACNGVTLPLPSIKYQETSAPPCTYRGTNILHPSCRGKLYTTPKSNSNFPPRRKRFETTKKRQIFTAAGTANAGTKQSFLYAFTS
jgi:hypothetical protein